MSIAENQKKPPMIERHIGECAIDSIVRLWNCSVRLCG